MPMNLTSLIRARIINNIRTRLPEYDLVRSGNSLKLTLEQQSSPQEYNETSTSAEWIDPYVKMDKKTNRYRKVLGYWRDVKTPVQTGSISGKSAFSQLEPKEMVETLLKKRL